MGVAHRYDGRSFQDDKTPSTAPIREAYFPSSSWINLVERFIGDLSQQAVCKGSFQSVRELARKTEAYIAERDLNPKRYVWRTEGAEILAKNQTRQGKT